jgi:hypothetical protein
VKSNAPALFYEALKNAIGATSMMPLNILEKATTKKIVEGEIQSMIRKMLPTKEDIYEIINS